MIPYPSRSSPPQIDLSERSTASSALRPSRLPLGMDRPQRPSRWKIWLLRRLVELFSYPVFRINFQCAIEPGPPADWPSGVIFAGNHASHFDLCFLFHFLCQRLHRPARGVAWKGFSELPLVGLLYYAYEGINTANKPQTIFEIIRTLQAGSDVWIQCEGACRTKLAPFHPGAALASLKSGRPIVPFSLRGTHPLFRSLPWPDRFWGRVSIRFHEPLLPADYWKQTDDLREATFLMTRDLRARVASEIDYEAEESSDEFSPPK